MSDGMISTGQDIADLRAEEASITEEFAFFDDWTDKYKYLIDLARNLPPFPEEAKIDSNKVSGCQSQVWFTAEIRDRRIYFLAASDAAIVSGLIALLLRVYSGRLVETVARTEPEFVKAIGLSEHLSPTRTNGLFSMLRAIKNLATGSLSTTY